MLKDWLTLLAVVWGVGSTAAAPAAAQTTRTWRAEGEATNLAVDKSGKVTLTIATRDSISFTATGQYHDGLVGRFTMNGVLLSSCQPEHICVQFSGSLQLGGEGGWPEGTQALYVMTLVLSPATGKGTGGYHLAPFSGADFYQHGILDLSLN